MTPRPTGEIGSSPLSDCILCGTRGVSLYKNLTDGLFGTSGTWNFSKCPRTTCGLIWLNPMPHQKEIVKAYRKYFTHQTTSPRHSEKIQKFLSTLKKCYIAEQYGYTSGYSILVQQLISKVALFFPDLRAVFDFNVMYLSSLPGGRLLDIGCGEGRTLKDMQSLGWLVEGVDMDPSAVDNARRKGVHVHLGTVEDQQYPDNYFDAVTISHLIEHIHNPLTLLCECRRILKPGGFLITVTPNSTSLGHRFFLRNWLNLDPPRHLYLFNPQTIKTISHRADFIEIMIFTTIRDANGLFIASRSLRRSGTHQWGSIPPLSVDLWAKGMQLIEWALMKIAPHLGEDLVLIAKK